MTVVAPRETRKERLSRLFDKAASIEARLSKLSLAAPTEDVDDEAFEGVQRPLVETTGRASVTVAKEEAPSLMLSTAQAAAIEQHSLTNMTTTTTMETHETAAPHSSTETTTSLDKKSSSHQETTAASKSFEVQKTKTTDYEPGLYMAASNRVTHKANELELLIGDLLQVTAILPDGWAFAMNLNTKDKGNVPLDCLERGVAASLEGSLSSTKLTKETRTVSDLHAKDAMDELNDSAKTVTLETTSAKTLVKQVHESEPNSAPLKEEIKKSVTSLDTRMVDGAASRESIHTLIDYENTPKLPQDLDMSPNLTFVMDDEQDQPLKEKYVVIRDRTPQKASELALFHGHVLLVTLIFSDGWCYA